MGTVVTFPDIAPSRVYASSYATAPYWLPDLTRKLMKRDLSQWSFNFDFEVPTTLGADDYDFHTSFVQPIHFPQFDIDHDYTDTGLTNRDLFNGTVRPRWRVAFRAQRVFAGTYTPETNPYVMVLLSQSASTITAPESAAGQAHTVEITRNVMDDYVVTCDVLDQDQADVIPTGGTWFLHVLTNEALYTGVPIGPGQYQVRFERIFGQPDCGFWLEYE